MSERVQAIGEADDGIADVDSELSGRRAVDEQRRVLPAAWRPVDRAIVEGTHYALFAIGMVFTLMITLEVISRYVFSFSISFVNALARLLLVWFFLLGASIALRRGAHVGFELLLSRIPQGARKVLVQIGLALTIVFCLEMIWSGCKALGPASGQTEAGLDISLVWVVAAIPCGFALLLYHAIVAMWIEARRPVPGKTRP